MECQEPMPEHEYSNVDLLKPRTDRELLLQIHTTLEAHILEDNRRWDSIAGSLNQLSDRIWAFAASTIGLLALTIGGLVTALLAKGHVL